MRTVIIILLLCAQSATSQVKHLYRNGHVLFYDPADYSIYTFGGADTSAVHGETWQWKNDRWHLSAIESPGARTFPSVAYDGANKRIILFGGKKTLFTSPPDEDLFLNDTWIFENKKWRQVHTSIAPSRRAEATLVFDPKTGDCVLFGGYDIINDTTHRLTDVWLFRNNTWQLLSPDTGIGNNGHIAFYSPVLQKPVMCAGRYSVRNGSAFFQWNVHAWEQLAVKDSIRIYNPAYAPGPGYLISFGGWTGKERINTTYRIDIANNIGITRLNCDTLPPARNHAQLVYDHTSGGFLLFGGHDGERVFCDVWLFKNGQWKPIIAREPAPRKDTDH
ncbi:MAG TPA: kelch repeat-containing protein [Chitinophagaceae bacterium]|nr:kelch repeat-containing protein [Chitinophagaceae bacterium]